MSVHPVHWHSSKRLFKWCYQPKGLNVFFAVTHFYFWIKPKCVGESCPSLTAFNLSPLSLLTVTGPMASPEWDEAVIPCDQWELGRERVAWSVVSTRSLVTGSALTLPAWSQAPSPQSICIMQIFIKHNYCKYNACSTCWATYLPKIKNQLSTDLNWLSWHLFLGLKPVFSFHLPTLRA